MTATTTLERETQIRGGLRRRRAAATIVVLLLASTLSACGGSDTESETDAGPETTATESQATVPPETTAPEPATTTEPTEQQPASEAGVSTATVTIAGETYTFGSTGFMIEDCNPNFFGGVQVILQMVDENGQGMVIEDQIRPVSITLIPDDPDSTAVNVPTTDPDREWVADSSSLNVQGSQVDDWSVDGNRIEGTATFVSTAGEGPEQGTFDVTCAEE